MTIIFLNRYFYPDNSATSQMLSDLAFALSKAGHRIAVITSRQRYDDPTVRLKPFETFQGVDIYRVSTPVFGRQRLLGRALDYLGFYLSASFRLIRLARRGDVVVVKTDPPLMSVPVALVARLRKTHLVNWLQDLFPEVAQALGIRALPHRLLRALRDWSLRQAEQNVVIGERMASLLQRRGISPEHIRLVHNWADGKAVTPVTKETNPLRKSWQLQEKFVVGYSGNLGRAHEFDTILRAAALLADEPDIHFLFIGAGAQEKQVREAVASHRLANVSFKPYQPRAQLRQSLSVPDVHLVVLRPELEGLIVPSKFYGIAAAGRASLFIGDAKGEVAHILEHCECGFTVAPGQHAELAQQIRDLRASGDGTRLGANARRCFERHFDLPMALRNWLDMLQHINQPP